MRGGGFVVLGVVCDANQRVLTFSPRSESGFDVGVAMRVLTFGIATVPAQRARSFAIAAGTRQRGSDEPNVWFPSVSAMARVLSDENMALLAVIREQRPDSLNALANKVGKLAPNVSRAVHTLARYGLVTLIKKGRMVVPRATVERVTVNFS